MKNKILCDKFEVNDQVLIRGLSAYRGRLGKVISRDQGVLSTYDWLVYVKSENTTIACFSNEIEKIIF